MRIFLSRSLNISFAFLGYPLGCGVTYKELLYRQPGPSPYARIQVQYVYTNHQNIYNKLHKESWEYLINSFNKPRGLSWLYSILQYRGRFTKSSNIINWERDLGFTFTTAEWQHAIKSYYRYLGIFSAGTHCNCIPEPLAFGSPLLSSL